MDNITIALTIFTYTKVLLFLILSVAGIFLIKLIIDLSKLTTNIDETTTMVKHELEPTIDELKQTLKNLNSIASATDRQFENARKVLGKVASLSGIIFGQFRNLSSGFLKGMTAGIQLFSKKQ